MNIKERYRLFIEFFTHNHPDATTELEFGSSFQLLIAVILSAQCTDKRINLVTPAIFRDFPTVAQLAAASFEELFPYIRSVSYPNNKTKHLIAMSNMLLEKFGGEVPSTIEELQQLPGVGRKTANVIASVVFNQPAMAVDTHVFRVAARIGLTVNAKTPLAAELQLIKHIPQEYVQTAHHWLILHGRYICVARRPKCEICPLTGFCVYYEEVVSRQSSVKNQ